MGTEPWDLAEEAAVRAGVQLRPLTSLDDADLILRVMVATWGDHQLLPREVLRALAVSGNVPYGAFAGDEMIGYVLGWAGVDDEGLHVHSHMLAALPDRRHRGVGYALKLAQRAQALEQGIAVARWTFDPLVARNAYFNLHKLGAIVDRFGRDFYGQMGDALNRGDRSDRFVVRWDLEREPGGRAADAEAAPAILRREDDRPRPVPGELPDSAAIEIPAELAELRASDPGTASAWRDAVASAAERCFAAGLLGVEFDRRRSAYLFAKPGREP